MMTLPAFCGFAILAWVAAGLALLALAYRTAPMIEDEL